MPETDLAVVGAGAAGTGVALLAAALGQRVALFERGPMGGEGPPRGGPAVRAFLDASGKGWETARDAARSAHRAAGVETSAARLEGMGVEVVRAPARFEAPDRLAAAGRGWGFRRAVLAVGAAPVPATLEGLETIPALDEAGLLSLPDRPAHLIVLGASGRAALLAQGAARAGSRATLLAPDGALSSHDPDLAEGWRRAMGDAGVAWREGPPPSRAERRGEGVALRWPGGEAMEGSHLLVVPDSAPPLAALDPVLAGLRVEAGRLPTTRGLRARDHRRVWVAGPAAAPAGEPPDRPADAAEDAALLARTLLFRLPGSRSRATVRFLATEPGLLWVGALFEEAGAGARLHRWPLAHTAEGAALGLSGTLVLTADRRGRLAGAGLLGTGARAALALLAPAVARGAPMTELASWTGFSAASEAASRAAADHLAPRFASPLARRIVSLAARLP